MNGRTDKVARDSVSLIPPKDYAQRVMHVVAISLPSLCVRQASRELAKSGFAVAIETRRLLVDVLKDLEPDLRRKSRPCQHPRNNGCRQARALVAGLQDGPGGAS